MFDTCLAYVVNGHTSSGGICLFSTSVNGVACSHLAPLSLYVSCLMGEGAHSVRVDKTSHTTIIIKKEHKGTAYPYQCFIIKQEIKQSFSMFTLCRNLNHALAIY